MLLQNPFGITPSLLPQSVHSRVRSFSGLSAAYCVCLWPPWRPYVLRSSPPRAVTFSSSECCRSDLSAGSLLVQRAGGEDLAGLELWSTLARSERTRVLYSAMVPVSPVRVKALNEFSTQLFRHSYCSYRHGRGNYFYSDGKLLLFVSTIIPSLSL